MLMVMVMVFGCGEVADEGDDCVPPLCRLSSSVFGSLFCSKQFFFTLLFSVSKNVESCGVEAVIKMCVTRGHSVGTTTTLVVSA